MGSGVLSPRRTGWLAGLLTGVLFGVAATAAVLVLAQGTWLAAIIVGLACGAVFGALMGRFFTGWIRRFLLATSGAGRAELRQAQVLLRHPDMDAEPATQQLAVRIGRQRLHELQRGRHRPQVISVVLVVIYVAAAIVTTPWWWFAAALFGGLWALSWSQIRSLRRSLEVLEGSSLEARHRAR